MHIEKATRDDKEAIVQIVNADLSYKAIIPSEYYKEPFLTMEELEKYLNEMDLNFFMCRDGGLACGVGALIVRPDGDGQLGWVFVLSEWQRKGVGTAIVAALEQEARERGISRMILETDARAEWAKSFYSRLGYTEYKQTPNPWGHLVWMEKSL